MDYRRVKWNLLKLTVILLIGTVTVYAMGRNSWRKVVDDVKNEIIIGSTSYAEVESFFIGHGLTYGFVSRESDRRGSPQFSWSSETASGYFKSIIPNVRTNWWKLAYENVEISIEIDHGVVSKVIIEKSFTGL